MVVNKSWLFLFKLVVSGGLIYWILRNSDLQEVGNSLISADRLLLSVAFLLLFVGYFLTAFRWRTLIRAQESDAPVLQLVKSFMVALFFNNFLPSTIGGDFVRMYDSWRIIGSRSIAVTVVIVDRFLGVIALFSFALIALTIDVQVSAHVPFIGLWVSLTGGAVLGLAFVVLFLPTRVLDTLGQLKKPLLSSVIQVLRKILESFQVYRRKKPAVLMAFSLSLALQFNVVIHFILIAHGVGIQIPTTSMFLIIPIAVFLMMLPIAINAIGVRETVFVVLLSYYGVPIHQALALAWVSFGFTLMQGVLGGFVFGIRKYA